MFYVKQAACAALIALAASANVTGSALADTWHGGVSVQSSAYPRIAAQVEQDLTRLIRRNYGQVGPIVIQISQILLDPSTRIRRRSNSITQRLNGTRASYGCGGQRLVYDKIAGTMRASYALRYHATGPTIGTVQAKARGRVSDGFTSIDNGRVVSRCGAEVLSNRQLQRLIGYRASTAAIKPLSALRDDIARGIAQDIFSDLKRRLRRASKAFAQSAQRNYRIGNASSFAEGTRLER